MIFFWFFFGFLILQRFTELLIAKRNAKIMFANGAEEIDKGGYKYIVIMHSAFFICLVFEKIIMHRDLNPLWFLFTGLFLISQVLRYWSIFSLGIFWNTRIIILKGSTLVKKGLYKYLSHPNYIAVITEIAVIPLIFSCYITAVIFSVLNLAVLSRRVRIEKSVLTLLDI